MTGYDRKTVRLSHNNADAATIRVELDLTGDGLWQTYRSFSVPPRKTVTYEFPAGFCAYWLRAVAGAGGSMTVQLEYE
jgi:hypothetical protein